MSKTAEELVSEVQSAVVDMQAEHNTLTETISALSKDAETNKDGVEKVNADLLETAEKSAKSVKALADQINDMEQKISNDVMAGKAPASTIGELLLETDECKAFLEGSSAKCSVNVISPQANTITGQDGGSPARNSDILVGKDRLAGIVPGAFRTLSVRDVIPAGVTNSNQVEYTRELVFTNAAAETEEGVTKPETTLTFEMVNAPVRTIAHFLKLSKQVRDDSPQLVSYINTRLAYGVELRTDTQLLTGNGTGQNISGLLDANNYQGFSPTVGETALDSLNRMKELIITNDYQASVIILNPADWGTIERLKDDNSRYVIGDPLAPFGPTLWGLPVVITNAMTAGKAYVAAMPVVAQVWNRMGTVVEMFEQDDTNVQQNLLTVRAENRLALAIYRPSSATFGALTAPGASA